VTTKSVQAVAQAGGSSPSWLASTSLYRLWQENHDLVLAAITLVALLTGWIGGSLTGALPQWAVTASAVVAFVAGGYGGTVGAIESAREGRLDIDFLMIAAALGAALIGEWEEGALLLFLFTLSHALEEFAMDRTRQAIAALSDLRPEVALVRRNGSEVSVPVEELQVGEIVLTYPGERLAVDGVVAKGSSTVDQSPITGESVPVLKERGDTVFAGTINGGGLLEIEMSKAASESTLSKIIDLVADAQEDAAPTQRFIDRFSQPYTYAVLAATALAFIIPYLFLNEPMDTTLYRAMTLLVVASPCALIISTPASILSAIAAGARNGVLFKGGAYLERVAGINAMAFDKTGTLTYGRPVVTNVHPLTGYSREELLRIAGSAELRSEHAIGRAVAEEALNEGIDLQEPEEFRAISGHGIEAKFHRNGKVETIFIGNDKLYLNEEMNFSPAIGLIGGALQEQGKTAMLVVRRSTVEDTLGSERDWEVVGYLAVADTMRPEAAEAVAALREVGVERIAMLTGDNDAVASSIASEVGITEVYSSLLPEQKVDVIEEMVKQSDVGMVGDGVNDAPALATAHVGIAMGAGGTDVALETADVVLMSSDLSKLSFMMRLGRKAERIVRQNVIFSVGVIITLVTLTIIVPMFVSGFVLPLPLGVVGHEGSTLIVVANGLRMLAMKPN
jgi:Cd2+/Zn2+-exporting ATPase